MSDDLVKRLRNPVAAMRPTITDGRLAADRIEALTAQLAEDADVRNMAGEPSNPPVTGVPKVDIAALTGEETK
jgi:hypothetical protein